MARLVIFGSRDFEDYTLLDRITTRRLDILNEAGHDIDELISGMARGADRLACTYASNHHISLIEMPADWDTHGKRAGYIRNTAMAKAADHALGFWDGESRGTAHMIGECIRHCKTLVVVNLSDHTATSYRDGRQQVQLPLILEPATPDAYYVRGPGVDNVLKTPHTMNLQAIALGNMHPSPITVGGITFRSAEALYQSGKFDDPTIAQHLASLSGFEAKSASRGYKEHMLPLSDAMRDKTMLVTLALNANQNHDWRDLLLSTGHTHIVELSNDLDWGCRIHNDDFVGNNRLGWCLEVVRGKLRNGPIDVTPENLETAFPWLAALDR